MERLKSWDGLEFGDELVSADGEHACEALFVTAVAGQKNMVILCDEAGDYISEHRPERWCLAPFDWRKLERGHAVAASPNERYRYCKED